MERITDIDNKTLDGYIRDLKVSTFRDNLDDILVTAQNENWTHREFLAALMKREVDTRAERRKQMRIKAAGFPQMKYLQELVREALPEEGRRMLPVFESLIFMREKRNIVMYGNPGTGKTHTAIGLGIKACLSGYSVYFTTIPHLLTEIREARTNKTLQKLENKFRKLDLVICDEMGYVSFDKEGAEMLFNLISLRSGVKPTIVTTNLPFTRWEEIIKDKVLCSAFVDRICHRGYLVNMTGQSYRVKETQEMLSKL